MRPPYFVPETMPALKSFEAFKRSETGCLFVMDEYGGFAGILTVENLIEEIVGQLSTGEGENEEITIQEDGTWLADGSLNPFALKPECRRRSFRIPYPGRVYPEPGR